MSKVAIVGCGFVGRGMQAIFPDATMIDPPLGMGDVERDTRDADLAIVCVPTPMLKNGRCDTSIVEEVVEHCQARLVLIKSTVEPGTTLRLAALHRKAVCFSPEYMGESRYHVPEQYLNPVNPLGHGFMIIGGRPDDCSAIADIFLPVLGPCCRFRFMNSIEAELVKYFENAYFSMKVTFANEVRRICEAVSANYQRANYHVVREGWLDDPRVGPMHTAAFKGAPGFSGKCLPKDTNALAVFCREIGSPSVLLEAVLEANERSQR